MSDSLDELLNDASNDGPSDGRIPPPDKQTDQQVSGDEEANFDDNNDHFIDDDDAEEDADSPSPQEDEDSGDQRAINKQKKINKSKKRKLAQFIDDEAELSGDDEISEDELEASDDDEVDLDLVDKDAKDLGSDEEEEVRRLYHKQLETEDRRKLLLLQEQLEENELAIGQRRRRKFHWQTRDLMETSLKRHYDPDDDDSQEGMDDDFDDMDYDDLAPRIRRPAGEALVIGSTKLITNGMMDPLDDYSQSDSNSILAPRRQAKSNRSKQDTDAPGPSLLLDDSNSNTANSRLSAQVAKKISTAKADMNSFVIRDRELVEALSTKEAVVVPREEKERVIKRELKRVLTSKSIFDQLYS